MPQTPSDGDKRATSAVERVWHGTDPLARIARVALAPAEGLYRGIVAARGALYDLGLLPARRTALPALYAALQDPDTYVLRGYGGDEPLVHATLNPSVPVVVSADRVAGVAKARVLGADVAVLDDAFQHRRADRWGDVVLVSADSWSGHQRLLPAGPWREPVRALRRAALTIITRKAATHDEARAVLAALQKFIPKLPAAIVWLAPGDLRDARGTGALPLTAVAGQRLHVIAAIGDPAAFVRQLELAGAASVTSRIFPDHYDFSANDATRLALDTGRADLVVCTLKDAVKLAPHWPAEAARLWYVSQNVNVEQGAETLDLLLDGLLAARSTH